jgi:hypothetical protein
MTTRRTPQEATRRQAGGLDVVSSGAEFDPVQIGDT